MAVIVDIWHYIFLTISIVKSVFCDDRSCAIKIYLVDEGY